MAVTASDIGKELGRTLSESEAAQAVQWIADARMLVSARLGDLEVLDQGRLDYVVRQAVVLRFRNPDGVVSESIDDYTFRYGVETRQVTILPEWWSLLAPLRVSGAFSTRPGFVPDGGVWPCL